MAKKTKDEVATMENGSETTSASNGNGNGNGKKCPVSRDDFKAKAKPLAVTIDGQLKGASVREFGSLGWYINEKMDVMVDGVPCRVQVGLNIVLIGSKEE